jgi:hypothetical protein
VKTATVDFEFDRLGLKLPGPHGKVILSGVTGTIQHGRVTAVMGPSGAGGDCALAALARSLMGCCMAEALVHFSSVRCTAIVFLADPFELGRQEHLCDDSGWQGDIRLVDSCLHMLSELSFFCPRPEAYGFCLAYAASHVLLLPAHRQRAGAQTGAWVSVVDDDR